MHGNATTTPPQVAGAQIGNTLARPHGKPRADLVPLAKRVQQTHAADPGLSRGRLRTRAIMAHASEDHWSLAAIPARAGSGAGMAHPMAVMPGLTKGLTPPRHTFGRHRAGFGGWVAMPDVPVSRTEPANTVVSPRYRPAA